MNPIARLVLATGAAVYAWRHAERLWKQVQESKDSEPQQDPSEPLSLDASYNEADDSYQIAMWGGTEIEQDVARVTWQMARNDLKA